MHVQCNVLGRRAYNSCLPVRWQSEVDVQQPSPMNARIEKDAIGAKSRLCCLR